MAHPICALSTPAGRSAIAIIRLTGEGCLALLEKLFIPVKKKKSLPNYHKTALYGQITHQNKIIDEVIVLPFQGPKSYTGEDCAEIHCHGNPFIIKKILNLLYSIGFDKAAPGEFTKRAYLNKKLDLTQVEAVKEIIEARSDIDLQNALLLKSGAFRKETLKFRSNLLNLTADISAELDFCDEDIEFVSYHEKVKLLKNYLKNAEALLKTSEEINRFRENVEMVIFGAPNVGKSSFLNYFSGTERAIVSEQPGTTRDYLEVDITIDGSPMKIIDTAGIHSETSDNIEKEGMKRSIQKTKEADIIFILFDASLSSKKSILESPLDELKNFNNFSKSAVFFILNKFDIRHPSWDKYKFKNTVNDFFNSLKPGIKMPKHMYYFDISLKTGNGLDSLHKQIRNTVKKISPHIEGIMMSQWQKEIYRKIITELKNSLELLENKEPQEIILSALQNAIDSLGVLLGEVSSEDILGRIFSRFCIGK